MEQQHEIEPCAGGTPHGCFMNSGWQCFLEQLPPGPRTAEQLAQMAFFAGAGLLWTGIRMFADESRFPGEQGMDYTDRILDEVHDYLDTHNVEVEWEPREFKP